MEEIQEKLEKKTPDVDRKKVLVRNVHKIIASNSIKYVEIFFNNFLLFHKFFVNTD